MTFNEFMKRHYPKVTAGSGWERTMAERVWFAGLKEGAKGIDLVCTECRGQGYVLDYDRGMDSYERETCSKCHGSGVDNL